MREAGNHPEERAHDRGPGRARGVPDATPAVRPRTAAWPSGPHGTTAPVRPWWAISASAAWMRPRSWCSPRPGVGEMGVCAACQQEPPADDVEPDVR